MGMAQSVTTSSAQRWHRAALLRRSLLLLLVLGQTVLASWFMLSILPYRGGNALEVAMLVLFAQQLAWLYRSLQRTGQLQHFDFFILSDSRDPDIWLREQAACAQLVQELGAAGRLFYRRRQGNLNY